HAHRRQRIGGGRNLPASGRAAPGHRACRSQNQTAAAPGDQRTTGRATARPADGWWVRRPYPAADSARRHRLELRPALVDEQASFERLAIFAGGCTLGAAPALFGDDARVGLERSHEAVAPDVLERQAEWSDK